MSRARGIGGRRMAACLALAALAGPAVAAKPLAIDDVAGVYKLAHKTSDGGVRLVDVEDVLELVKVSPTSAYVRIHLIRQNGHICALHGVADLTGEGLVYRERGDVRPGVQSACRLTILADRGGVEFRDGRSCSDFCGVSASFDSMRFPSRSKRPIRYMTRLLASREYAEAVASHGDHR